jgi:hypothetical protein
MKKLINDVQDVLDEQLAGLAKAHPSLTLHQDPVYVTRADAPVAGKVALLSGGGRSRCTVVISVRGCFRGPVRAKFSPHRRPIKSLNAPCKLMAAKVYC